MFAIYYANIDIRVILLQFCQVHFVVLLSVNLLQHKLMLFSQNDVKRDNYDTLFIMFD